ncbi:MAG: hypothetical protein M3480_05165 [Verrucomicrobiota bacterium]|nr:hypothetical protein [Chthoniobacterales bacterium]MDQ3414351.1 hypothetical protein [Verrucomicrobiota bacterium]
MEGETRDKRGESPEESAPAEREQTPLSKLRDLRPEKDPIGAGRGFLKADTKRT